MNDLFNENQQPDQQAEALGSTRVIAPVSGENAEVKPTRRRRTERFAGLIDEADSLAPAEDTPAENIAIPDAAEAAQEPAQATRATPAVSDPWKREQRIDASAFAGVRVPARSTEQLPSQGVPRPAALSGQQPHRAQKEQSTVQHPPVVRRPVNAAGYGAPLQQLGTQEQPRVRRPEGERPVRQEAPRRIRTPETERIAYEDVPEQEEEQVKGRGLIAVIIALLVLAALILHEQINHKSIIGCVLIGAGTLLMVL